MGNRKAEVILGVVVIVMGIAGILNQVFGIRLLGYIDVGALVVLGLGLFFEWLYFSEKKAVGLLVPGGILTVVGLCDFLESFCGGFIFGHFPSGEIGVALGLLQLYWFGKRNPWLLLPVGILVLSALEDMSSHFFGWFNSSLIWPIGLVVLGLVLIISRDKKNTDL